MRAALDAVAGSRFRFPVSVIATAVMYFAVAKLSLVLAIPPGYATAVWPPSGIALALMLLHGPRMWPGIWLGATAVNFSIEQALAPALFIGVGNTLEAVAASYLARQRLSSPEQPLSTTRDIIVILVAAAASAVIAASIGTGALWGAAADADIGPGITWLTWWMGDFAGMVVFAPLIISWARPTEVRWTVPMAIEFAVIGILVGVVTVVGITFLVLPFAIWVAIRFGTREVTTLAALVGLVAVGLTVSGQGPFVAAAGRPNQPLLILQVFVVTMAMTGLLLAVLVRERERVAESLRRTQRDLEQYLYVAAHDLQEPLRGVINFSELLQARHRSSLNAEGGEFLEIVVSGASKMHRRIEDLLEYSRVSHGRIELAPTDSGRALSSALRTLDERVLATGASVGHDALPRVLADERMLAHVFENLIGNALKYCGKQPPRVHVSARREGDFWRFHVRDAGIGIEPKHAELIFNMYQRLHAREQQPGSGLGLSICRRIVERHGGRIWLESGAAGHTCFAFTVPAEGSDIDRAQH